MLKWSLVEIGVLLFFIFINNFPQRLRCNAKLFSDDTSVSSTTTSPAILLSNFNEDLPKITQWGYQWKMLFNQDIAKLSQEIIFFERKIIQVIQVYTLIMHEYNANLFKNILVYFLDEKLSFWEHIAVKIKKSTIGVNLMRKLNLLLPRSSLLTGVLSDLIWIMKI